MPDLGGLLDWGGKAAALVGDFNRAESIEFMLGHRGVSLVLVRSTGALAAQTALLVPVEQKTEVEGAAGVAGRAQVVLIGVRGHATLADFDVKRGDRFSYNGTQFEVTHVDKTMPGKTEARAEALS